jgi:hypothetical protein
MRPRVFIPGPIGWVLIAAAVAPILIKKAKPVALKIADGLSKMGEKLREATLEGTDAEAAPPNGSVENKATTKRGKAAGVARSASPAGQAEVQAQHAAEASGKPAPEKPPQRAKARSEAQPKPEAKLNPKRTARTPAKAKAPAKKPKRDAGSSQ